MFLLCVSKKSSTNINDLMKCKYLIGIISNLIQTKTATITAAVFLSGDIAH